jgi:hypothetical protein
MLHTESSGVLEGSASVISISWLGGGRLLRCFALKAWVFHSKRRYLREEKKHNSNISLAFWDERRKIHILKYVQKFQVETESKNEMFDKSERRKVCGKFHIDSVFVFPPFKHTPDGKFSLFFLPQQLLFIIFSRNSRLKRRAEEKKLHSQINWHKLGTCKFWMLFMEVIWQMWCGGVRRTRLWSAKHLWDEISLRSSRLEGQKLPSPCPFMKLWLL